MLDHVHRRPEETHRSHHEEVFLVDCHEER
jgi:hypothetical protein